MIERMDHMGIVVDDLAAATAFFVELGLELQGEGPVEGTWVDRVVGLKGVRADFAVVETPDGHGRLELTKFHTPLGSRWQPTRAGEHTGHPPCRIRRRRHRRRRRRPASPWRGARWRAGALRGQLPALLRPRPGGDHRRTGGADQLTVRRGRPATNQRIRLAFRTRILLREVGVAPRGGRMVARTGRRRR